MANDLLNTPLEFLKGVGPARAELLKAECKLHTFRDLLHFFPFRYVDRSRFYQISEVPDADAEVQIIGSITSLQEQGSGRNMRLHGTFSDGKQQVRLIWFKGIKWIKSSLKLRQPYVLYGKPNWFQSQLSFPHPELELLTDFKKSPQKGLQPVYHSTEKLTKKGLNSRGIQKLMKGLIPQIQNVIGEFQSDAIIQQHALMPLAQALTEVHFPSDLNTLERARYRLKFDEFFFLQLEMIRQKNMHQQQYRGFAFPALGELFHHFYDQKLPFELTGAQKRVLKEIRRDLMQGHHMNRLVQGDVGSGKTIVALICMLMALDNGFQACMMAPTEILANQHYQGIKSLLKDMPVRVELLTGSVKARERKAIHQGLEDGSLHILIGTHALIEDKVKYQNLGLAVVDEQHRFGVAQRARLWKKNRLPPHVLVMTATPIPRTLAMTMYGNLDISVIDELPPGRKPITTLHRSDNHRLELFAFLKQEIALGRQVYIVYPLIEESESMDYKDLMDGYESVVRAFPRPDYQVSIVHGKMKPQDKDWEMQRFVEGKTHIMVATTVIEVGVNVPNASVMVIESAERFGLSQLHQLRGRVGRGAEKSYCILMSSQKISDDAQTRLKTMTETQDGFVIAEVDMQLRGPGDMMGTKQSGLLDLKIADLSKDGEILERSRYAAVQLLKDDPQLEKPENAGILKTFQQSSSKRIQWSRIS